jgi:hypothetical protein
MGTFNPHSHANSALEFMAIAGAGEPGVHTVITSTAPFVGNSGHYVYAMVAYTDGVKFTTLREGKLSNVASVRLDAGGDGYPQGELITGKFTAITPEVGSVVGAYIMKL